MSLFRWNRKRIALYLCLAVPLSFSPVTSQTILREAALVGEVQANRFLSLREQGGHGLVGLPISVEQRHSGEWVLTDQFNSTEVEFFSPSGEWKQTLGREGDGPGEFKNAWFVHVLPDDGLLIWDAGLFRITRYDSDLNVLGATSARVGAKALVVSEAGDIVVAARSDARDRIGLPLHRIDSIGRVVNSFGADPPIQNWGNAYKSRRRLALAGSGAVWSADMTEYSLERWTVEGTRTAYLVRDVPWFEPRDDWGKRPGDKTRDPPEPRIEAVHQDSDGFIWVMLRIPDQNWQDAYVEKVAPWGEVTLVFEDENKLFDTVIEVIDPAKGTVEASGRFDEAFVGFTQGGVLFGRVFEGDMVPVVELWEAQIQPRKEGSL